ncbi:molybdopterin converting factor subunit 1 [Pseudidiomarina sp.]|uniref:molybdopterin converting factor subunit 1 n=1 Tax=Pseudidiomarina sp. TaxID=2081707 RepID=UPI00299F3A5A|nr:molybdopterin converting factor subunit 1 [Pseudidiomarina sp.]MDX1705903.1 molybdopterin converting factor subunit 1 [Pseudidiomarina sp.]
MLTVKLFAALRERLDCASLTVDATGISRVSELKQALAARSPKWQHELSQNDVLCAVNQQLAAADMPLQAGDEVAFFPPVTGG